METETTPSAPHSPQVSASSPSPSPKKSGLWNSIKEWARVIVIALIIALPVRFFIAEPFVVNGASMDPTFSTGQFLIVDRLTYRFEAPSRGDVIVFKYPNDPSVYYIKRIIGLPGDTVSIKNGRVSVRAGGSSGVGTDATASSSPVLLDEPYIDAAHLSHDTGTFKTLGPTEYFVMGDNRAQSSDSRAWGSLDRSLIIGRPIVRLTPLSAVSVLPGEYHEEAGN